MAGHLVKQEDGLKICAECAHQNGVRCGAKQVEYDTAVDVVSGDVTWIDKDGLGQSDSRPLCEEVNEDGKCSFYEDRNR